jgi:hypothetical protein
VEELQKARSEREKSLTIRSDLFSCDSLNVTANHRRGRRCLAHRNSDFDTFLGFPTLLLDLLRKLAVTFRQSQVSEEASRMQYNLPRFRRGESRDFEA